MARYEVDRGAVSTTAAAVRGDATTLRSVADAVAAAAAAARSAVGSGQPGLAEEIDRFRVVHATLVDAMSDAVTSLCGALDLAVRQGRDTELAAAAVLGSVAGTLSPAVVGRS